MTVGERGLPLDRHFPAKSARTGTPAVEAIGAVPGVHTRVLPSAQPPVGLGTDRRVTVAYRRGFRRLPTGFPSPTDGVSGPR